MKSRAKVISQKHIREIPPFCDNPTGKEMRMLNELVKKGAIVITKPRPMKAEPKQYRRMNRNSN